MSKFNSIFGGVDFYIENRGVIFSDFFTIFPYEIFNIEVESTNEDLLPFLLTIPLQKLAYYSALKKGYDIDKPRNLAKSVTVE